MCKCVAIVFKGADRDVPEGLGAELVDESTHPVTNMEFCTFPERLKNK